MADLPRTGLREGEARRDWFVKTRPAVRPLVRRVSGPILGVHVFSDTLVRERKRADRFGSSFAVLLVDRSDAITEPGQWTAILRAGAVVKGGVATVGWLEQDAVLGLLLPEVSGSRARKLTDRLGHEIARRLGDGALIIQAVRLYGHGIEPGPDGAAVPPIDLLLEAFVPQPSHPWRDAVKRGVDMLGSFALLAVFSPVMLAIAAAVKSTSPGPVLYRHTRVGQQGQPFTMLKFRTMRGDAGHGIHDDYMRWFITSSAQQPRKGDEVFKLTNDPRITPVGRLLRKTSLDELPQFWNVLRGDMSLVGPRPPLSSEVEHYQPWHRRRVLELKPGITGLWQTSGRSRTTFDDMVRMDLRYARTYSMWTDIKILAATPRAMFKGAV